MNIRRSLHAVAAIVLSLGWNMAGADLVTADELRVLCKNAPQETIEGVLELSETDRHDLTVCQQYTLGAREMWTMQAALLQKQSPDVFDESIISAYNCTPQSVTLGQNIRVFKRWVLDNPELAHLPAAAAIMRATQDAFCK